MKSVNNKGFSLVELIVVVAIMAVLMGVLAPQYLRYVEKSRLQKDNTAIAEICESIKTAMADETINASVTATATYTKGTGDTGFTFGNASTDTALTKELNQTVGAAVNLTSNSYQGQAVTITVTKSNGLVYVGVTGYISAVGQAADATAKEF